VLWLAAIGPGKQEGRLWLRSWANCWISVRAWPTSGTARGSRFLVSVGKSVRCWYPVDCGDRPELGSHLWYGHIRPGIVPSLYRVVELSVRVWTHFRLVSGQHGPLGVTEMGNLEIDLGLQSLSDTRAQLCEDCHHSHGDAVEIGIL
jgi:hypothetical protein